jgi:hypothetical protein
MGFESVFAEDEDGMVVRVKHFNDYTNDDIPWLLSIVGPLTEVISNMSIWAILRQNTDPSSPIIKSWKMENLCKFGGFLVYRIYLNEKNTKMARKIR